MHARLTFTKRFHKLFMLPYLGAMSTALHEYPPTKPIAWKNVHKHRQNNTKNLLSQVRQPGTNINTAMPRKPAMQRCFNENNEASYATILQTSAKFTDSTSSVGHILKYEKPNLTEKRPKPLCILLKTRKSIDNISLRIEQLRAIVFALPPAACQNLALFVRNTTAII